MWVLRSFFFRMAELVYTTQNAVSWKKRHRVRHYTARWWWKIQTNNRKWKLRSFLRRKKSFSSRSSHTPWIKAENFKAVLPSTMLFIPFYCSIFYFYWIACTVAVCIQFQISDTTVRTWRCVGVKSSFSKFVYILVKDCNNSGCVIWIGRMQNTIYFRLFSNSFISIRFTHCECRLYVYDNESLYFNHTKYITYTFQLYCMSCFVMRRLCDIRLRTPRHDAMILTLSNRYILTRMLSALASKLANKWTNIACSYTI